VPGALDAACAEAASTIMTPKQQKDNTVSLLSDRLKSDRSTVVCNDLMKHEATAMRKLDLDDPVAVVKAVREMCSRNKIPWTNAFANKNSVLSQLTAPKSANTEDFTTISLDSSDWDVQVTSEPLVSPGISLATAKSVKPYLGNAY